MGEDLLSMGLGSKSIAESDDIGITEKSEDDLIIDEESHDDAQDNDYDQYTECISQERYGQDCDKNDAIGDDIDESIIISDEESRSVDDTLTNFIDKAADQYFDDHKGEKEKNVADVSFQALPSTSRASASVKSTLFQSASDLMKQKRANNQTSKQSPTHV